MPAIGIRVVKEIHAMTFYKAPADMGTLSGGISQILQGTEFLEGGVWVGKSPCGTWGHTAWIPSKKEVAGGS